MSNSGIPPLDMYRDPSSDPAETPAATAPRSNPVVHPRATSAMVKALPEGTEETYTPPVLLPSHRDNLSGFVAAVTYNARHSAMVTAPDAAAALLPDDQAPTEDFDPRALAARIAGRD